MAPRPSQVRHRIIVEQIAARQGKLQVPDATATAANSNPASAISRFSPYSSFHDAGNGFLSPWNATDGALTEKVPGLKASATFLSSLRTNLSLPDCPSPAHSPLLTATHHPPPPSPLIISSTRLPPSTLGMSTPSTSQLDLDALPTPPSSRAPAAAAAAPELTTPSEDPPPLTTYRATSTEDQIPALKLIADSIAQQSSTASKVLIYHPLNLAIFTAICAVIGRWIYNLKGQNLAIAFTTLAGVTVAGLSAVKWVTHGYTEFAEGVGMGLLDGREVWVSKFGEEVIGAAVVGWDEEGKDVLGERTKREGSGRRGSGSGKRRKGRRAEIVAWTVRLKYRGKGVGESLLEAVVDDVKSRGAEVGFAEGHVNSKRILWDMYNREFDKKEHRARVALQNVWDSRAGAGKRKK
ncbi:acetyltransferase-like protein 19 [Elsinoe australis]|uniref:Acetyltransferase-like protein 19 n=1 Tax=Elsinoe australis TaxID=40998 RepID=A0A4U7APE5_9PEZI|nr:acetyltransferase-like protein 19 [Elsinoe australis]